MASTNRALKNDYPASPSHITDGWLNAVANYLDRALLFDRISQSVAGSGTIDLSDSSAEYDAWELELTGVLTGNKTATLPLTDDRLWLIYNNTSGSFTLTVKGATGTGVIVPQGKKLLVYTDGTNFYQVQTALVAATIYDGNGNEVLIPAGVASAVNEVTITSAATGNAPIVGASGSDSNIGLSLKSKGTGVVNLLDGSNLELLKTERTASAVNEVSVVNAATGGRPVVKATGDDTNISLELQGKGTGTVIAAANVADANTLGAVPVLHRVDVPAGTTGDIDVTLVHKTRVIRVWLIKRSAAGGGAGTIQVKNGATAITDAISIDIADQAFAQAATYDDAAWEIAASGTLRVTRTRTASTDETCSVYVEGHRVA